ncbi:MAG: hypothetical protein ABR587_17555 [Candidatus Binatia bacterium]
MRLMLLAMITFAALMSLPNPAQAQHADIELAASGGSLVAVGDFAKPILLQQGFCAGGLCLYSATDPGLVTPATAPAPYTSVASQTALRLEIVSIDANTAVKVGTTVLDAPGESGALGSAPNVHIHPSWQLTAPAGAMVQKTLSMRITAQSGYQPSPAYDVVLTTFEIATTTTTTTTTSFTTTTTTSTTQTSTTTTQTSTTTVTMAPSCGDGVLDFDEDCERSGDSGSLGNACTDDCRWATCGDADHSGAITATDALHTLRTAVSAAGCDPCVCDVRESANVQVSAADALWLLRKAVGGDVQLQCPACS